MSETLKTSDSDTQFWLACILLALMVSCSHIGEIRDTLKQMQHPTTQAVEK